MNRCPGRLRSAVPMRWLLAIGALACALVAMLPTLWPRHTHAQGIDRPFPKEALRGMLVVTTPPELLINGRAERLSPGARIRSADNLLVVPTELMGQRWLVNYRRDPQGMVHEVWILTAQEARERRAGMPGLLNRPWSGRDTTPRDDGKTPYDQLPSFNHR